MDKGRLKQLETIAANEIQKLREREGLDTRRTDDADFLEVAVWEIRNALEAAYIAGQKSVIKKGK